MNILFKLLLMFSSLTFSQSAKVFLINDNVKIFRSSLTEIISESKNYGYNLYRDKQGEYIFDDGRSKYIILKKSISDFNYEDFPDYSVGTVYKKYNFVGDIDEAKIFGIETEIRLSQYENVSVNKIKNNFNRLKDDINKNNIKNNYVTTKTTNKLNHNSFTGQYFDLCYESIIQKPCPESEKDKNGNCIIGCNLFLMGETYNSASNIYHLVFSFQDNGMSEIIDMAKKSISNFDKLADNLRFNIGELDMRKINQYDLEAMIKCFLDDCKKHKKSINNNLIKATFERLDGSIIALSYGYDDDEKIIIKVDPEKWASSSIEKRWYILYHELGHDVLNLEHGQGGKMMFNFVDKEYTWDDFFNDKEYMFNFIKSN